MARNEDYLERPLPSNEVAERTVLGTILLVEVMIDIALRHLDPNDFYNPINRRVFDAMRQLRLENRPISPITIPEIWKSEGVDVYANAHLGPGAIAELSYGIPYTDNKAMEDLCIRVKEFSIARQMILNASMVIEDLLQGQTPVQELIEKHEGKVMTLNTRLASVDKNVEKPFSPISELVPEMRQQFENYHNNIATGVPTGMEKVDRMLDGGGLQAGGLYLVAAGEKSGKTSLALDWVDYISIQMQLGTCAICTGEMAKVTMAKRLYSSYMGIPYWKFRPGLYDAAGDPTYTKAMQGLAGFSKVPILIADKLHTIGQIKRHFRRIVENGEKSADPIKKIQLAVVDYVQLIELDDGGKGMGKPQQVEKVSRELKKLATELGIPVVTISSLNRIGIQSGEATVPDTFNLRDAQSLAFDCEALFFLHNPAYIPGRPYEPKDITPMNLILARQRNGPTGTIPVMFIGPYMQFMTAEQYERNKAAAQAQNIDADVPLSQGQMFQKEEDMKALWH